MSRARSAPPELPGFTLVRAIGGGGFADVFLYDQHRPNRAVAVKVLRSEHLSDESLRQFENEADVMAEVSAHPYIVTIYSSGVAPDGRPYIVMEHYPKDHFGTRALGGRLTISEVLRVGIQVSSAVETAHRAGILHRDIKPSNILTSAYGRPGLTDFGIAGVKREEEVDTASGVSIAFASPEALSDDGAGGSVSSDVYSLTATLYALLAGRSPRWMPGGDNSDRALLARALTGPAPMLSREDVPSALVNLLANGLASEPSHRPGSALALAQGLQDIEQELHLPTTPIEVREDGTLSEPIAKDPHDEDGTRRAGVKVVHPDQPSPPVATSPPPPASRPLTQAGAARVIDNVPEGPSRPTKSNISVEAETPVDDTVLRDRAPKSGISSSRGPDARADASRSAKRRTSSTRTRAVLIGTGMITVIAIGAAIALTQRDTGPSEATATTTTAPAPNPGEVVQVALQPPTALVATLGADGKLVVNFTPTESAGTGSSGISYRVTRSGQGGDDPAFPNGATFIDVDQPPLEIDGFSAGEAVCVEVSTVMSGRISTPSPPTCAAVG